MPRYVDYVDEDKPIAGQKHFLASHVRLTDGSWWVKIRSVWGSLEQAERVAKQLIKQDDTFDVSVGDVGKWVPATPSMDQCERVEYSDEHLNELFRDYKEGQRQAKDHFDERKALVMRDGIDAHLAPEEVIPPGDALPPPLDERAIRALAASEEDKRSSEIDLPLARSNTWRAA